MRTIFLLLLVLTACNTVHGLGQDIKKTGQTIERVGK